MPEAKWGTVEGIAASSRNSLVGGPFGSNLVSNDYVDNGIPVIRGQNMGKRWVSGEFAFVTIEKARSLEANLARAGDIIFTQRGTLGQVSLVPEGPFERYLISQSQMKLTVDREVADPLFYYYVFSSPEQQDYVKQHAIQTGVPHTNLGILRNTPITIPPLREQRAIAQILGTLDDKIELNRRMNETLEAIARALFKSWFIDFDPVRAKASGSASNLLKHIADLFPNSFVDSDLGEIPKSWQIKPLGELVEFAYGRALKAEDRKHGPVPVYGSNGQVGWHSKPLAKGPGIVVGRKGNPGIVTWVDSDFFPIDTTFYVVPRDSYPSWHFLFHALREQKLASLSADSAVPGLNRNLAYLSTQLVPPQPITDHFEQIGNSLAQRASALKDESRTLVAIRDALLPELISGNLRPHSFGGFSQPGSI